MAMRAVTSPIRTLRLRGSLAARKVVPRPSPMGPPTVRIAGTDVHLTDAQGACEVIADTIHDRRLSPLAVVPATLGHPHHEAPDAGGIRHLTLIEDGRVAARAKRVTGAEWPRLAGGDLIGDVLNRASAERWRVAVVGGSADERETLHRRVMAEWPGVALIGHWTPTREQISSPDASAEIAEQLRHTDTDLVIVCVGRATQEEWIDTYGQATGARVLLAADTVMDFLTGRAAHAPRWVGRAGLEKMWRLMLEPKRSATRNLIEEPQASLADRRSSAHHDA